MPHDVALAERQALTVLPRSPWASTPGARAPTRASAACSCSPAGVVPGASVGLERQRPVQHRAVSGLDHRGRADLPDPRLPLRAPDHPHGPLARHRRACLVAVLFLPDRSVHRGLSRRRRRSRPAPCRLPGERLHAAGLGAGRVGDVVVPLREALAVILLAVVAPPGGSDTRRQPADAQDADAGPGGRDAPDPVRSPSGSWRGAGCRRRRCSTTITAIIAFGLPALCVAFLLGLFRWRIHTADCLVRLAHALREPLSPRSAAS